MSWKLFKLSFRGQFHQHFMSSFYPHTDPISAKRQWWLHCLFVLLGSVHVKAWCKLVGEINPWRQFHQHLMHSFYMWRSQKRKYESQVISHFALLGSMGVKAAHKHVGEIDPWSWLIFEEGLLRIGSVSNSSLVWLVSNV